MARAPSPLFLERGTYRRRRVMDAIKLVAVLGAGLWMVPVLWPTDETLNSTPVAMSEALFFIFGIWVALIALSGFLMRNMRMAPDTEDTQEEEL